MDPGEAIRRLLNTVYYERGGEKGTIPDMRLGRHEKVSESRALTAAIREEDILRLLARGKDVFLSQPPMLEINAPVKICGDTHGQFSDLLRIFGRGGFPPSANYLFLGDYVDRGKQNLETILLLTCYKLRFPKNFFLLRGNHECSNVNRVYGFMDECQRRYQSQRMWQAFQDMFDVMPLSAVVGHRILCMHGGISPHLKTLDDLRRVSRPTDATGDTLEMDLLWADPVIGLNGFQANQRGASYGFGPDVLTKFLRENDLDMVARAHQVVQDGYEFFGGRRLVTIFSAPHYCGQFDNAAAILSVDSRLSCSFEILRPQPRLAKVESRLTVLSALPAPAPSPTPLPAGLSSADTRTKRPNTNNNNNHHHHNNHHNSNNNSNYKMKKNKSAMALVKK